MGTSTKQRIERAAKELFALQEQQGLSMRRISELAGTSLSVTYHYFKNKDALLKRIFISTTKELGERRAKLPRRESAAEMLRDRIGFQIDNSLDIVFVLKYYMHYRNRYKKHPEGYLPATAYLHITEVLEQGVKTGEFQLQQSIDKEAKVIAHAINGYLLEYFPASLSPEERGSLISSIHGFILRAVRGEALQKASI